MLPMLSNSGLNQIKIMDINSRLLGSTRLTLEAADTSILRSPSK